MIITDTDVDAKVRHLQMQMSISATPLFSAIFASPYSTQMSCTPRGRIMHSTIPYAITFDSPIAPQTHLAGMPLSSGTYV
ncbi:unnamed protein product [Callosobruchus maculatus]|uniref:Uncharacterized protein n=1 Tax=Callosobruchus maculatus TaxID=64391 RepID=A0A653C2L0_CALMS|nr:unnamed protein product [Callosobruchus maculatus]